MMMRTLKVENNTSHYRPEPPRWVCDWSTRHRMEFKTEMIGRAHECSTCEGTGHVEGFPCTVCYSTGWIWWQSGSEDEGGEG